MDVKGSAYFDLKTVALLREAVEDAWVCLRPEQRETMSRSLLAERILKAAAQGERDPQRCLVLRLLALPPETMRKHPVSNAGTMPWEDRQPKPLRKPTCYRGCNRPSASMVFNASTSDRPRWRQNQVPVCRCHWRSKRSRLIQSKRVNGASNSSPRFSG